MTDTNLESFSLPAWARIFRSRPCSSSRSTSTPRPSAPISPPEPSRIDQPIMSVKEALEVTEGGYVKTSEEEDAVKAKREQLDVFRSELLAKVDEHNQELHDMEEEMSHLAVFKAELLKKAEEHLDEHHRMEAEQAQLAVFKKELMEKVDEHLTDLHKKEDKAAVIAKLKEEMGKKVDDHGRAVGLRASF